MTLEKVFAKIIDLIETYATNLTCSSTTTISVLNGILTATTGTNSSTPYIYFTAECDGIISITPTYSHVTDSDIRSYVDYKINNSGGSTFAINSNSKLTLKKDDELLVYMGGGAHTNEYFKLSEFTFTPS